MNNKRWAAALAGLTAAGLLTACSGGTNAASGSGSGPGGSGTLTVATVDTYMPEVVKAFEAQHPGVKVNLTTSGTDAYQQQVRTQLASGTAPDVLFVWPGNGNPAADHVLAKAGYLEDLSGRPWADKYPSSIKDLASYDGKVNAGLFAVNGIGAIYNEQAVRYAGLSMPTTWSSLLDFCKAAKAKGKAAFALGNQTNWITQLVDYALVPTTVYNKTPDFDQQMAQGKAKFAGSGWVTAMDKYLQMNQSGCFQKNPLGTSYEATIDMVATGKALGLVNGNWVLSLLQQKNAKTDYVLKPLPATDNASETKMAAATGGGYAVNAHAKNKKAALAFVDFMMSDKGMALAATKQGGIPVFKDVPFTVPAAMKDLSSYLAAGQTVPFMDQYWPNAKVQEAHLTGVQDLFSGNATPEKVLAKMDDAYAQGG